jgi:hypothetical protein
MIQAASSYRVIIADRFCFNLRRPELNIKPWDALSREIGEGNAALHWTRRAPYAFWKGNPTVGTVRWELLKCNVSRERDWKARIYAQARPQRHIDTVVQYQ